MTLCPYCQLPATGLGRAIAATSADDERHGVVCICRRCTATWERLPRSIWGKTLPAAVTRALDDPVRYGTRLYPDAGAAQLVTALLGHPDYAEAMLEAMGVAG